MSNSYPSTDTVRSQTTMKVVIILISIVAIVFLVPIALFNIAGDRLDNDRRRADAEYHTLAIPVDWDLRSREEAGDLIDSPDSVAVMYNYRSNASIDSLVSTMTKITNAAGYKVVSTEGPSTSEDGHIFYQVSTQKPSKKVQIDFAINATQNKETKQITANAAPIK